MFFIHVFFVTVAAINSINFTKLKQYLSNANFKDSKKINSLKATTKLRLHSIPRDRAVTYKTGIKLK